MLLTEEDVIKLADLGIAKFIGSTECRTYAGSPAYMSPDVLEAFFKKTPYTANIDIWYYKTMSILTIRI